MKIKNVKSRSSRMRILNASNSGWGMTSSKSLSFNLYSNTLSPYSNVTNIPWTNISITHNEEIGQNQSKFVIKTKITFSPSSNYTSYSVSDVFQYFEPINIFIRNFYIPTVDEDEKTISTIPTGTLSLIHNDWRGQEKNVDNILFYQSTSSGTLLNNTFKYVIVAIKENNSNKLNKYFFIETNPEGKTTVVI